MTHEEFAQAAISILAGYDLPAVTTKRNGLRTIEIQHHCIGCHAIEQLTEMAKENYYGWVLSRDFDNHNLQIIY